MITVVCAQNTCRSPATALLLAAALGPEVSVASAGTHATEQSPMDPRMLDVLEAHGLDGSGHRAHQVTASELRESVLVIGIERPDRTEAVRLEPTLLHRAATLVELAAAARAGIELEGAGLSDRLKAMAPAVAAHRHRIATHTLPDPPDPAVRRSASYGESYSTLASAVDSVAGWLLR